LHKNSSPKEKGKLFLDKLTTTTKKKDRKKQKQKYNVSLNKNNLLWNV